MLTVHCSLLTDMTRYILTYPDGLVMLVGIDQHNIRMIGTLPPLLHEQGWKDYYEYGRMRPITLRDLNDGVDLGYWSLAPWNPEFEDFWTEYGEIYNQVTAKGAASCGSKADAIKVWRGLSIEQRRAAYSYLANYKYKMQTITPTCYKKHAATYLNPKKGDWVL